MEKMLHRLRERFPQLRFREGRTFYWSPGTSEVFYTLRANGERAVWSLLHETSHAILGHNHYNSDFELLQMEVAAWQQTRCLSQELSVEMSEDHIQDCLDTYRDWLFNRSICPQCNNRSLQQPGTQHYRCFNCHALWKVTSSRFCRTYRATGIAPADEPIVANLGILKIK